MSGTPEASLANNSDKQENVFQRLFSQPLLKALEERGFTSPTDPQMKLVPLVAEGQTPC
jgi:superfamily II DNA/RNA helicase